jgi:hypothetical protein
MMLAALVLVATRSLSWTAFKRIPFGTLVLLGGSFALAAGIEGSGLSSWLARVLDPVARLPLASQLALASFATIGLSAVASNTATINLMLNVLPRSMLVLSASSIAASVTLRSPRATAERDRVRQLRPFARDDAHRRRARPARGRADHALRARLFALALRLSERRIERIRVILRSAHEAAVR